MDGGGDGRWGWSLDGQEVENMEQEDGDALLLTCKLSCGQCDIAVR